MRVAQMQKILAEAERFYRAQGNQEMANGLEAFDKLFTGFEKKTVDALSKLIANTSKSSHSD